MLNITETALDKLLKRMGTDPIKNLEALSVYLAGASGASCCFIVTEGFQVASDKAVPSLPADALEIPVRISEHSLSRYAEKRASAVDSQVIKGYVYLGKNKDGIPFPPEITTDCCGLMGLIGNNLVMYQTHVTASTDKLTGAINRKYLDIELDRFYEEAEREGKPMSVIMCDIDSFKHVNDTFGHLAGDDVLRDVSKTLQDNLRRDAVLSRYGGEEFLVVLSNTDCEEAMTVAERLRAAVFNKKILGTKRDISISLGAASYPEHARTVKTLVEKADGALYMAKNTGRNKSVAWDEAFAANVSRQTQNNEFLTGDMAYDAAKVAVLYSILDYIRQEGDARELLALVLDLLADAMGASFVSLLLLANGRVTGTVLTARKDHGITYNQKLIDEVIQTRRPLSLVDWDNDVPDASGISDWQSLAAAPALLNGELQGVLYAGVSVKTKEFTGNEATFLGTSAALLSILIKRLANE